MIDGDHSDRAPDELGPHQGCEPARRLFRTSHAAGLGRYDGELTHRIHEHDANVTEMLELERQLLLELVQAVFGCEFLHGRGDKALSNFERGFDFDAGRGARVDDGDDPGEKRRNKIDGAYGDQKLRPDRAVIPKLLQHGSIVSTPALPQLFESRGNPSFP